MVASDCQREWPRRHRQAYLRGYRLKFSRSEMTMNDADRIEALLDLVDPDRPSPESRGPQLAVLGLAAALPKGGYRPTKAGWSVLGDKGRGFRSSAE